MKRRPPRSTRTDTLFPYTTLFRSDYIDPGFHAAATGRASINLDGFAMTPAMLRGLAAQAAGGVDLIVAEAAMGLFDGAGRSEEHTSELQSLMRISYAVFCLKKTKHNKITTLTA